ncbi:ankyrin repeat domain-containing protein [Candidatus Tisiphia endosymbiont of Dascillus cervinus]|uniref:ankyrin repeat domain-containing protein n=1 Tax=Candidatus Tisiphia endosymbiont of Dascillus cervinus TaxID=3066253 RepID=UPI00312C78C2
MIYKKIAEKTTDINYKAIGFSGNTALHLLVANTREIMFSSELNNELRDANQVYIGGQKLVVVDEDLTLAGLGGIRLSDGYTVNQEKTLRITKFLTDRGADINAQNDEGLTPFFMACTHKFNYLASCFVSQFWLDFSIKDFNDQTALHYAALLEDTSILQLILNKGVDINSRNSGGGTPLYCAVHNNKKPIVEFLLNKGADVNIPNNDGIHILHVAVGINSLELIKLLVKYGDINIRSSNDTKITALWLASQDGRLDIVKALADLGADLNIIRADTGASPLYIATHQKRIAVVEELLARGADVNIPNNDIYPLHLAVNINSLELVKLLVKYGDINIRSSNDTKITALWLASQDGRLDIVKALAD